MISWTKYLRFSRAPYCLESTVGDHESCPERFCCETTVAVERVQFGDLGGRGSPTQFATVQGWEWHPDFGVGERAGGGGFKTGYYIYHIYYTIFWKKSLYHIIYIYISIKSCSGYFWFGSKLEHFSLSLDYTTFWKCSKISLSGFGEDVAGKRNFSCRTISKSSPLQENKGHWKTSYTNNWNRDTFASKRWSLCLSISSTETVVCWQWRRWNASYDPTISWQWRWGFSRPWAWESHSPQ